MNVMNQTRARACMTGVFILVLALSMLLSGCQALSPRALAPSPTPILLRPEQATIAPTADLSSSPMPAAAPPTAVATATAPPPNTPVAHTTPGSIMALGTQPTVSLRALPAPDAAVVAQVSGAQVLWARGRDANGAWLWVTYNEAGRHAWVAARDVKLLGDTDSLPDITSASGVAPTRIASATTAPTATAAPIAVAPAAAATAQATPTVASAPVPTRAPLPTRALPGRVVFHTAIGGEIYIVNADGTGLRRLTNGFDPALSPDGTQLAFVRWGPPDGLYLLDLRTGEERQLFTTQEPRGPAWSPDGARIVFSHNTLKTTCLDTPFGCFAEDEVRNFFGDQECIDSPQGRFCIADFPLLQVDLTDLVQVTMADNSWLDLPSQRRSQTPSWHPKRNEILYTGRTGLQILPMGEETRPLVNDVTLRSASWSPDGQRIVAQAYRHDRWEIVLLDAAGNILAQLTGPDPLSTRKPNNVAPAWSPDGRSILFLSDRDDAWRVYRMNADGSGQALFLPQVFGQINLSYNFSAERSISWGK